MVPASYLSLLIGEIVPKRVALSQPEQVARSSRGRAAVIRVAAPIVKLLTGPTNLVLRVFGIRVSSEPSITVGDSLARQQGASGVVEDTEHQMVEGVFRLGDRLERPHDSANPARMDRHIGPAGRVRARAGEESVPHLRRKSRQRARRRGRRGPAGAMPLRTAARAGSRCSTALYVPATLPALTLLEQLRASRQQLAVALGSTACRASCSSMIVETVIGDLPLPGEGGSPPIVRQGAGG